MTSEPSEAVAKLSSIGASAAICIGKSIRDLLLAASELVTSSPKIATSRKKYMFRVSSYIGPAGKKEKPI